MKTGFRLILLFGCSLALTACDSAPAGPAMYDVSGTVTFDGAPLSEGQVIFRATGGQGQSAAGQIKDGQYVFESTAGQKQVSITSSQEIPGEFDESNPGEKVPMVRNIIPAQYSEESTLKAEVTESSADNKFDFDLKSE